MFNFTNAFSGFSVNDLAKAKDFYSNTLDLRVVEDGDFLRIYLQDGTYVFAYPKADHQPATYTMLNFDVPDINEAVNTLAAKGVTFERYPGMETDENGIVHSPEGPPIAWFKDSAGNILAVMQT